MCKDLKTVGFDKVTAQNFSNKHCYALRDLYRKNDLATATIKNRLACVRWLGEKLGKELPSNQKLEIENRKYSDNSKNKAQELDSSKLEKLSDRQQLALRLQREFGLRREESLKFNIGYADKGEKLELKASWCKGGRAREIPIITENQRQLLSEIREKIGNNSLIEKDRSYIQARENLDKACQRAEIKNMHGFRHKYAQDRYLALTGLQCPKNGGLISKELNQNQKELDRKARLIISSELGHNREEITVNYLGR